MISKQRNEANDGRMQESMRSSIRNILPGGYSNTGRGNMENLTDSCSYFAKRECHSSRRISVAKGY